MDLLGSPSGGIYTLLSAASITGTFDTVTGLPDGYALDYTADSLLLVPSGDSGGSVPEPGTLALLGVAALPVFRRRRVV